MPMAKAFLYSALLHVAVVVAAFAVPIFFDIFDINPLPGSAVWISLARFLDRVVDSRSFSLELTLNVAPTALE